MMQFSETERVRARRDIERQLAQLRETGTVEVLDDMSMMLLVRFTPIAPRDGTFDTEAWDAVREPVEMLIDPFDIMKKLRAQAARAARSGKRQFRCCGAAYSGRGQSEVCPKCWATGMRPLRTATS